ncbi:MAG TPA: MBL fold metallo-hydrolase [Galbitalea sp.]|jgi:glyoxylase-like metal-dependent hydrolase (beta-lactamase superfamily II)
MPETGPLDRIRDDVWALRMPMPGEHMPYSFAYLLRDSARGIHVIDPGLDRDDNWALLIDSLALLGGGSGARLGDIRSITATHLHPDHLGMAARLRQATGVPLILHRAEQEALERRRVASWTPDRLAAQFDEWGVPTGRRAELTSMAGRAPALLDVHADVVVDDGDRLGTGVAPPTPGFDLVAMWTPGHTPGSLSLRDDARNILFTGDHVLPVTFSGLGLGGDTATNALADYLASLDAVARYPGHEVLPGHEHRFTGVTTRVAELAQHHLRRTREVAVVMGADAESNIWQIASRLTWTAGWSGLTGFFLFSALSQTAMHRAALESPFVRERL